MTDQPAPTTEGQAQAPEGQGQAQEALWYKNEAYGFTPEQQGYIENKGWKDSPNKILDGYQNLEKFHGVPADQIIKMPKDPNAEGAFEEIYNRLGRPESPDKYDITFPDGFEVDKGRFDAVKEIAHKAGLNTKQLEMLAKFDAEYQSTAMEAYNKQEQLKQETEYKQLQSDWGAKFKEREELSRRGLNALLPEGADKQEIASKIEKALGTALTLKLFANAGDRIAKEHTIHESTGDRPFGYTREQALADRRALMNEISSDQSRLATYNQGKGNDYEKMQKLIRLANDAA